MDNTLSHGPAQRGHLTYIPELISLTQPEDTLAAHKTRSKMSQQPAFITQDDLYENSKIKNITGESLTYRKLIKHPRYATEQNKSFAIKLGRLMQGLGSRIKGTDTAFWISYAKIPSDHLIVRA
jgi:hypothetical protein